MPSGNLFQQFERPLRIPDQLIELALNVASDTECVELLYDVGSLIKPIEQAEADVLMFADLVCRLASRPSTTSPIMFGALPAVNGKTFLCARWRRDPRLQSGYTQDWEDCAPSILFVADILIHPDRVKHSLRTFARGRGYQTRDLWGALYIFIPRFAKTDTRAN